MTAVIRVESCRHRKKRRWLPATSYNAAELVLYHSTFWVSTAIPVDFSFSTTPLPVCALYFTRDASLLRLLLTDIYAMYANNTATTVIGHFRARKAATIGCCHM